MISKGSYQEHASIYDSRKNKRKLNERRFGELVVRKVGSLNTKYAKAKVQHLINNILYDAEVGVCDEPTHTLTYYTSPSASSSGALSLNSITSAEQLMNNTGAYEEVLPGQIVKVPLTWALATSLASTLKINNNNS